MRSGSFKAEDEQAAALFWLLQMSLPSNSPARKFKESNMFKNYKFIIRWGDGASIIRDSVPEYSTLFYLIRCCMFDRRLCESPDGNQTHITGYSLEVEQSEGERVFVGVSKE